LALKKVGEGTRTITIDKVIGKTKNGIEVNGQAYWYSKKSGQSVEFDSGDVVSLNYSHLKDSDSGDDVYMIQSLDNTAEDKDKMIDKALGENNDTFPTQKLSFGESNDHQSKDDKITNMNILARATEYCYHTGNIDEYDILEACKMFKKMLSKF
tara:strand:+ start:30 stop:491 length:462 start_codon:yes stop_codon:yes gene_type:complete